MVNLRGGLRGLGQAFTFLGQQGMERQQREENDRRLLDREMAMARFTQTIRNEDAVTASARSVSDYEALTGPTAKRAAIVTGATAEAQEPYREAEDTRTAERAETAADRADRRAEERDIRAERRAEAAEDRRVAREAGQRGTTVSDRYTGEDGFRHYRMADGSETVGTVQVRESGDNDEENLLGAEDDVGSTVARAAGDAARGRNGRPVLAARRPTGRGSNTPPVAGARRAADGNWYVVRNGRTYRVEQ